MQDVAGNNRFVNNRFSWHVWSADVFQTPDEVREAFRVLNIQGRIIVDIRAIGRAFNLLEEDIDDYDNGILNMSPCWRCAEIDEPIIITLDNGDRIELLFSEGSSLRVSKNCLAPDIQSRIRNNFFAAKLFSCCIGKRILKVEVEGTNKIPGFTGSHGLTLDEQQEQFISRVSLILQSGNKMVFQSDYDYGWIEVLNANNQRIKLSSAECRACSNIPNFSRDK